MKEFGVEPAREPEAASRALVSVKLIEDRTTGLVTLTARGANVLLTITDGADRIDVLLLEGVKTTLDDHIRPAAR